MSNLTCLYRVTTHRLISPHGRITALFLRFQDAKKMEWWIPCFAVFEFGDSSAIWHAQKSVCYRREWQKCELDLSLLDVSVRFFPLRGSRLDRTTIDDSTKDNPSLPNNLFVVVVHVIKSFDQATATDNNNNNNNKPHLSHLSLKAYLDYRKNQVRKESLTK